MSGIIEAVIGVVISLIFIVIGGAIIWVLYPINPFMAIVGIGLLLALAVAIVVGFVRSNT
ncbi:MAG: hypothetical protein ABSB10_02260 [Candidatus Bathyarchaeia archaeon]